MEAIRNLINVLNYATSQYNRGTPKMSDEEWDKMYFNLQKMEDDTHIIYPDSPTQQIHFETVANLQKNKHEYPMLSLAKTKSYNEVDKYFIKQDVVCMAKMDGLSLAVKYVEGRLVSATTRGNGEIGEDVTHSAKVIHNLPQIIPIKEEIIVAGEVICPINVYKSLFAEEYKNQRNFAAGSIRLLSSGESKGRYLSFIAWDIVKGYESDIFHNKLEILKSFGFEVVPYIVDYIYNNTLSFEELGSKLKEACIQRHYPIDGLVFRFDDDKYGLSLGSTAHHPQHSIAFKFTDDEHETFLTGVEWGMGRLGTLCPIALFEEVEIDSCAVSRASLHNLTVMRETLGSVPYIGQQVNVIKANQIIPQIESANKNNEPKENEIKIPDHCPYCGQKLVIQKENESEVLYCGNPDCEAKFINQLDHMCGRKGLDIKGLSKATLEKLIDWGWVEKKQDIFNLSQHRNEWIKKPGFGVKSVDKILAAIEESRKVELDKFIASLGIPLVGTTVSKLIAKEFNTYEQFKRAIKEGYQFSWIEGIGPEIETAILNIDIIKMDDIANFLSFEDSTDITNENGKSLEGINVVITGTLDYGSRDKYKEFIESLGCKVQSSVNGKTNYLIANKEENSSKYKKALELCIPIVTEKEFEKLFSLST